MTTTAIHRQPQPDGASGLSHLHHIIDAILFGDAASFSVDHVITQKTGREFLFERRIWKQIAGKLPDCKLVIRHVRIERVDHPVSPRPHRAFIVTLIAIGIGVPSGIEPCPCHAFAIGWRIE